MTTTSMSETYINALLADAAYVQLHNTIVVGEKILPLPELLTGAALTTALANRLTLPLANVVTDNFEILNQEVSSTDGFDATVWRGKAGTDYAGKVYVSMRGTQGTTDIADDVDLATSGLAHRQLVDMVNWWLRETTAAGQDAKQIALKTTVLPAYPTPITSIEFVTAPTVKGTGVLSSVASIESVNGHSLGGYMVSSFVRLFGNQWPVGQLNTFNSAGFSNLQTANINDGFNQIASLIGASMGLGRFATSAEQNNYFAENGINVTTNTWKPVGFNQYGERIAVFQEDKTVLTEGGINNHFMYKLTDLLALGNAIYKLDSSFNIIKINELTKSSSNNMDASYESLLDAFRKIILGGNITPTEVGDVSNGNDPQPPTRIDYQNKLKQLTDSTTYQSLIGKVQLVAPPTTTSQARTDLGAFLSLYYLTPFAIHTSDAGALNALYTANQAIATKWNEDRNLTSAQLSAGQGNFSDLWLADRAAMLSWIMERNNNDIANDGYIEGPQAVFVDNVTNITVNVGTGRDVELSKPRYLFGDADAETMTGGEKNDHLFGAAGSDTLYGQDGNDYLEGGEGADILYGDAGNDTLIGGTGNDQLTGGGGYDTYQYTTGDGADVITDKDGKIVFNGITLTGGKKQKGAANYVSVDGKNVYSWNGGDLTINGSLTVKNFNNKQLGIYLDAAPDSDGPGGTGRPRKPISYNPVNTLRMMASRGDPLVLDLDHDNQISTVALTDSTAYFDVNGDGIAEKVGWITGNDGILVRDRNGNGAIDGLDEAFGSATINGFNDLGAEIDSNQDGVINAQDTLFGELKLWRDANQDGISQAGELRTLTEFDITEIGLDYTSSDQLSNGNLISALGSYTQNGQTHLAADVDLSIDYGDTISDPNRATGADVFAGLDQQTFNLPWLRGYGAVQDLTVAYQSNADLKAFVQNMQAMGVEYAVQHFDQLLSRWSGLDQHFKSAGIAPASLRVEDKVWMLESFIGVDVWKSRISEVNVSGGRITLPPRMTWNEAYINSEFDKLIARYQGNFLAQAFLSDVLVGGYYSLSADAFVVSDVTQLTQSIANYIKNAANVTQASLAAQVLIGIKQDGALLDNNLFTQTIAGSPYEKLFVDVANDASYAGSFERSAA